MANCFLFLAGLIVPAVAGAVGYSIWLIVLWAAVLHLIARSDGFRAFAGLERSPDTSSAPVKLFVAGWAITLLPMLLAYGVGWALFSLF